MNKRLILAFLLILSLVVFAGCSNKDDGMIRDYDNDGIVEDMDDGLRDLGDGVRDGYDDVRDGVRDGVNDGVNDWDDMVDDVRDNVQNIYTTDGAFDNNGEPRMD